MEEQKSIGFTNKRKYFDLIFLVLISMSWAHDLPRFKRIPELAIFFSFYDFFLIFWHLILYVCGFRFFLRLFCI